VIQTKSPVISSPATAQPNSAPIDTVRPSAAEKLAENPGVDVAAAVVAHVDDQTLTIKNGVELAHPVVDVVGAHFAEVDVTDAVLRVGVNLEAPRVFPLGVAEVGLVVFGDGGNEDFANLSCRVFHLEHDLVAGLAAQQRAFVGGGKYVLAVNGEDYFTFLDQGIGTSQRRSKIRKIGIVFKNVLDDIATGFFVAAEDGT